MEIIYSNKFRRFVRIMSYILLVLYVLVLGNLLFFNIAYGRMIGDKSYNLIPFRTIKNYLNFGTKNMIITNIYGNIIAFMPMGFFVPVLYRKTRAIFKIFILSATLSFCIEATQYKFSVGSFDVDDIILNTLGGVVGYIVYKLIYYIYYTIKKMI